MARLRLLQPYAGNEAGDTIELPGGLASTLVLRRIADIVPVAAVVTKVTETIQIGDISHSVTTENVSPGEDHQGELLIASRDAVSGLRYALEVLESERQALEIKAGELEYQLADEREQRIAERDIAERDIAERDIAERDIAERDIAAAPVSTVPPQVDTPVETDKPKATRKNRKPPATADGVKESAPSPTSAAD